ncbi:MAG TPA: hydroxyethylthiazole kinase [bacterium]|nr:hydroxyethylthiazole kinase [bacterium]
MTRSVGDIAGLMTRVRSTRPLVHHITNIVTINDVANVTAAIGAAPVMARAPEEVEEIAGQASALVLNTGTLTRDITDLMVRAGRRANHRGVPVILDPVGAGGTAFRSAEIRRLLAEIRCACIRGNAGEIAALAGLAGHVRGVDAAGTIEDIDALSRRLAASTGATVAATGVEDLLTNGTRTVRIANGHPWLARISGSGCMATACIGAVAAIEPDPLAAATAGLVWFEVAAECAAGRSGGPGTFRAALLDALNDLDGATAVRRARTRLG